MPTRMQTRAQCKARGLFNLSKCAPRLSVRNVRCRTSTLDRPASSGRKTLLRENIDGPDTVRAKFENIIRSAQDSICKSIEDVDGTKFREDSWLRSDGGGGITRVMQGGNVWEKAGVAVSVVYGSMSPEAYKAAAGPHSNVDVSHLDPTTKIPFFAAGISSVMHPYNPHCPTMHFNYRYFETDNIRGLPAQYWFGGGTDITPCWIVEEDMKHFHGTYKQVCDRHDLNFYPKFKAWCDEYFTITHRKETRGLGGIFYDNLNDRPTEQLLAFADDCAKHVTAAYCPIIKKHMNDKYTEEQKQWQQLRRGRYVEFNLIYDRGTIFGLKTGGRVESILMSMPLTSRWQYDYEPLPDTPEAEFMKAVRTPRNWV